MMPAANTTTTFDRYHPVVAVVYFAAALVFAMCVIQPVYLLITFMGAFGLAWMFRGARAALHGLLWQAPVILLLALLNPVFVGAGSTELFRIGTHAVYAESALYGACQGLMLVNVLLIGMNAASVISFDKLQAVCGNALPTVSLMVSMVMRLVPQFARRGRSTSALMSACTAAQDSGSTNQKAKVSQSLRLSTVLMGWGLEDSLESASAMQARAWGASARRTSYARNRFRLADGLACALLAVLAASSAIAAISACTQWSFYPAATGLAPWFSYAPYIAFVVLPAVFELLDRLSWEDER